MGAQAGSKAQEWFRLYSENLANSYRASALIQHRVTKGETRERQILDLLRALLPTRASIETNVVIVDSEDAESPKFDVVLLDRHYWPRLLQEEDTAVAMIESVVAAIEVKSHLGVEEIEDIRQKAASLRGMVCAGSGAGPCPPVVTAFAYACDNLPLAFFDFARAYARSPAASATMICVLNKGLLCLCCRDGDNLIPVDVPVSGLVPALAALGPDTLMMYVYLLSGWASLGGGSHEVYRAYGGHVFASATVSYFDQDYLGLIAKDEALGSKAREAYLRRGATPLAESYAQSRRSIGLG